MQYNNLTIEQLVRLFQENNDKEAFKFILNKLKDDLYTYIISQVKDENNANDIFQDTFFKVIKSIQNGYYIEEGKFKNWIFKIAHNLIIDYFRTNNKKLTVSAENDEYSLLNNMKLSNNKNIEQQIIKNQTLKKVKNLINLLPQEQKEIIILRIFVGMSYKEISEKLDININTALGRMRYALINIRKLVKKYNIDIYNY